METESIFEATAAKRKVKKEQKAWKYIQEVCSLDDDGLDKLAIIDGNRKYTYKRMFREWERYASVFTALDMTEEQTLASASWAPRARRSRSRSTA